MSNGCYIGRYNTLLILIVGFGLIFLLFGDQLGSRWGSLTLRTWTPPRGGQSTSTVEVSDAPVSKNSLFVELTLVPKLTSPLATPDGADSFPGKSLKSDGVSTSAAPRMRTSPKFGADVRSQAKEHGFYLPADFLDESKPFGLRFVKNKRRAPPIAKIQCPTVQRVVVAGDSHLQHPFHFLIESHSHKTLHATYLFKGTNFSLRVVADTAVFSKLMSDSAASILLRRALQKANDSAIEAFRHDVVFVNRGVWDLVRYNTNASVIGQEFYEALQELYQKWVKKKGGKIVVMPLYGSVSPSECLSRKRIVLARLAVFAAIHRFANEKADEAVVTNPNKIDGDRVNILIFDMYDYLASVEGKRMFIEDGHHLNAEARWRMILTWLRVANCEDKGKPIPVVDALAQSAFVGSTSRRFSEADFENFWKDSTNSSLVYPKTTEPCGCLAPDVQATHPKCDTPDHLFSRQRRHLLVQYLLRHGIQGAADAQVHEMINIVCSAQDVLVGYGKVQKQLQKCREMIGVDGRGSPGTDGVVQWVRSGSVSRHRYPRKTPCVCLNETTTIQNIARTHCATVEFNWMKSKESCIYMNASANFDEG